MFPLQDWIPAAAPAAVLCFTYAKTRLRSPTIKLSSTQRCIIYTDLSLPPPARIISLGPSLWPVQLGNKRTGVTFQRLCVMWRSSLNVIIPWVTFVCLFVFWGGTGLISESEWSVEFVEWKINMLYTSMHSKFWWRLRFLTTPAVNTVSFFFNQIEGQNYIKTRGS